jgi:hypothetical protein
MIAKTYLDRLLFHLTISSGIGGDMPNVPDRQNPSPTAPKSRALLTAFGVEKGPLSEQTRKNNHLVATTAIDASSLSP